MKFKLPMLAPSTPMTEKSIIQFPVYVPPKIDGIRGHIQGSGTLLSRSLKTFPNKYVQALLSKPELVNLDGELTYGPAYAPDVYRKTNSAIMSIEGEPKLTFNIFDYIMDGPYKQRRDKYREIIRTLDHHPEWDIVPVPHPLAQDIEEFRYWRNHWIEKGYEGCMLRYPNGAYKHGRATAKEVTLFKCKEFTDSEARIVEVIEAFENTNEAFKNEAGYTARSTAQAGKCGKNTLGAFVVEDLYDDWHFKVGTFRGLLKEDRRELWQKREELVGQIIKYKYLKEGMLDVPRHPVFLGFRNPIDM